LADSRAYSTTTEFGLRNADGSMTYLLGFGLVWDARAGTLAGGTVTAINHYSASGQYLDGLGDLALAATAAQAAFESAAGDALRELLLAGNDRLDARYRIGDQVLPSHLIGFAGNDFMRGGTGPDEFWGYAGFDTLEGGAGNDVLNGGGDADTITGNGGDDRLVGDAGADLLAGGTGDDALYAGAGSDTLDGGTGSDIAVYYRSFFDLIITPSAAGFTVIEPNGIDSLLNIDFVAADDGVFAFEPATGKWSRVAAGPGVFVIEPENRLIGTAAADTLQHAGANNLLGRGGDDHLTGTGDWDLLMGGSGNDTIAGEAGPFTAVAGQDRIFGGIGHDLLLGMGGTDLIYGGGGNDRIAGGNGSDTLTGGAGHDVFVFRFATAPGSAERWDHDIVSDFTVGTDRLRLQFGPWAAGTAPANLLPALTLTPEGWKVTLTDAGSILLKGVVTPGLTLADLLA
jgi:Ca2+-binding RTX toxin-like protein